jgi:hypothetical protein
MFNWLKECFGKGKIRIEGVLEDGRYFHCKVPYIGDPDTLDKDELFKIVQDEVLVEYGHRATSLKFVGMTRGDRL